MDFDEDNSHIMAMKSLDGEIVPLIRKVKITPDVEVSNPIGFRTASETLSILI